MHGRQLDGFNIINPCFRRNLNGAGTMNPQGLALPTLTCSHLVSHLRFWLLRLQSHGAVLFRKPAN